MKASVHGLMVFSVSARFSGIFLRGNDLASWEWFVMLWANRSLEGESANVLYSSCKTKREVYFVLL